MVDKNGATVILKNNKPKYILLEYSQLEKEKFASNEDVEEAASNILSKHIKTFEELAK